MNTEVGVSAEGILKQLDFARKLNPMKAWLIWKVLAVTFGILAAICFPAERVRADDRLMPSGAGGVLDSRPVVVQVRFDGQQDVNALARWLDIWSVNHEHGILTALVDADEMERLRLAGYAVTVDLERTAELYPIRSADNRVGGIPGYPCYRTVEESYGDLAQLAADYPDLASWEDFGDSWAKTEEETNGYDLRVLVLTNRTMQGPKPVFLLMAAIHAREYVTAEIAVRFAENLVRQYDVDPDISWLLDHTEIHIFPFANPDGRKIAEAGFSWRKNVNNTDACLDQARWGVDLNRNSTFKWGACDGFSCSSPFACDITYRGSGPASEPETQAVETYMRSVFADQRGPSDADPVSDQASGLMITLHSYGEQVLFPWGWTFRHAPNDGALRTLGQKFGYFTGYTVCQSGESGCIYQTDGSTDDRAYGELGIGAYTFELGTSFFQECSYFEDAILDDTLAALRYAVKAARQPYRTPSGPEVISATVTPTQVVAGIPVTLTVVVDGSRYANATPAFGLEVTRTVSNACYTFDQPAWIEDVVAFQMTITDGKADGENEGFHALIDTTELTPGRHLLLIEGADVEDNWGVPSAVFVDVLPGAPSVVSRTGPVSATPCVRAEPGETGRIWYFPLLFQ